MLTLFSGGMLAQPPASAATMIHQDAEDVENASVDNGPIDGAKSHDVEVKVITEYTRAATALVRYNVAQTPLAFVSTICRYGTLVLRAESDDAMPLRAIAAEEVTSMLSVQRKCIVIEDVEYDTVTIVDRPGVLFVCAHNPSVNNHTVRHEAFIIFNLDYVDHSKTSRSEIVHTRGHSTRARSDTHEDVLNGAPAASTSPSNALPVTTAADEKNERGSSTLVTIQIDPELVPPSAPYERRCVIL
jgi:hypothetical protein